MTFKLVIVESPSKARTIQKYLDSSYRVVASFGHVMDLPEREFGVDIENDFTPELIVTKRAIKTVKEIKTLAKSAEKIILAADPDREGEAICSHLSTLLTKNKAPIYRIELHEITKKAVLSALNTLGKIKVNLVESQITRRVLDRIVGYRLSPVLWRNLHNSTLSAGRVQSVVLRWICERELEIQNFKSEEYWKLSVKVKSLSSEEFAMQLKETGAKIQSKNNALKIWENIFGKSLDTKNILEKEIDVSLFKKYLEVIKVSQDSKKKFPPPPFITASLQKEAGGKLKLSTKKTMSIAQRLYEGIYCGAEFGTTGLITYMRTDSTRLSEDFKQKANQFINQNYGKEYLGNFKSKFQKKDVQDAHEAIRPADISIHPEKLKGIIAPDEWNLYNLIWKRTVASLMSPEEGLNQSVEAKISEYSFVASGRIVLFDGFTVIYPEMKKEKSLPSLSVGENLKIQEIKSEQKYTEPPSRYTEATIVEKMEKEGIGRPSTYSNTIEVLYKRKYAIQKLKSIFLTELGLEVNSFLTQRIPYLFENHFTRDVEEDLDKIATGTIKRLDFLNQFYSKFQNELRNIELQKPISKKKKSETDVFCPLCQNRLLLRKNPKGKNYLICSKFPECEHMVYVE